MKTEKQLARDVVEARRRLRAGAPVPLSVVDSLVETVLRFAGAYEAGQLVIPTDPVKMEDLERAADAEACKARQDVAKQWVYLRLDGELYESLEDWLGCEPEKARAALRAVLGLKEADL